jgi:hypothetical protein
MPIIRIIVVTIILSLNTSVIREAVSNSLPLRINLLQQDEFVTRTMKIFKRNGNKYRGITAIRAYDPEANALVVKDIQGDTREIPLTDIKKMEFEQHILEQMSVAQMAAWKISAVKGEMHRYRTASEDFRIESGVLELKNYEEITEPAAGGGAPDSSAITITGALLPAEDGNKIPEPRRITYDSSQNCFYVDVQTVVYRKQFLGGGGSSGSMKPLQ